MSAAAPLPPTPAGNDGAGPSNEPQTQPLQLATANGAAEKNEDSFVPALTKEEEDRLLQVPIVSQGERCMCP